KLREPVFARTEHFDGFVALRGAESVPMLEQDDRDLPTAVRGERFESDRLQLGRVLRIEHLRQRAGSKAERPIGQGPRADQTVGQWLACVAGGRREVFEERSQA